MNQEYKPKYDQMRDNQPGKPEYAVDDRLYHNPGYGRKVGLIQLDGSCEALNYAYLIRLIYLPVESAIYLVFAACTVKIEGYRLKPLYLELFDDRARFIECVDERYMELSENDPVVTKIIVLETK